MGLRILRSEGVRSSSATEREVEEYRPFPLLTVPLALVYCLDRLLLEAILALRDERRDEGGAYSAGGRGGYGSIIRTS